MSPQAPGKPVESGWTVGQGAKGQATDPSQLLFPVQAEALRSLHPGP